MASAMESTEAFLGAAGAFADLVDRLPTDLTGPGLGDWDLRALVGHTSRAMATVSIYLGAPEPDEVTLSSAAAYLATLAEVVPGDAAIVERGRAAGDALGDAPSRVVRQLLDQLGADLDDADPDRALAVWGGSIRLRDYLPTRTFELVVHGVDLAAAAGLTHVPPATATAAVVRLSAEVVLLRGEAPAYLRSITGRTDGGYSIV